MSKKKLLKSNSAALRWCQNRRAVVHFTDWIDPANGKLSIQCEVHLAKRKRVNKTLLKTVNTWIQYFNGEFK